MDESVFASFSPEVGKKKAPEKQKKKNKIERVEDYFDIQAVEEDSKVAIPIIAGESKERSSRKKPKRQPG